MIPVARDTAAGPDVMVPPRLSQDDQRPLKTLCLKVPSVPRAKRSSRLTPHDATATGLVESIEASAAWAAPLGNSASGSRAASSTADLSLITSPIVYPFGTGKD